MDPQINYWAVLVSGVAHFVIGGVWYSVVFGKVWTKALGLKEEEFRTDEAKKAAYRAYLAAIISACVMAFVLAHWLHYANAITIAQGLQTAFWAWLGFIATTMLMNVMFQRRPIVLFFVDSLFHLVALMVMGTIMTVWT